MTYLYMEDEPLYRFGYGLTYSEFTCEMNKDGHILVKNIGNHISDYVVQIYESPDGKKYLYGNDRSGKDVNGEKIPIGSRLVYFNRLHDIKPGETGTI